MRTGGVRIIVSAGPKMAVGPVGVPVAALALIREAARIPPQVAVVPTVLVLLPSLVQGGPAARRLGVIRMSINAMPVVFGKENKREPPVTIRARDG